MQNAFPTIGAAVLYLNGFHHGEHIGRLNYLSRLKPEWVTSVANHMWSTRNDGPIGKGLGEEPRHHFYADILAWSIRELYVQTFNEQVDAKQVH
jgi:hypothetical protein